MKTPDDADMELAALAASLAEYQQARQDKNHALSDQPMAKGDALREQAAALDEGGRDETLDRRAHRNAEAELAPTGSATRTAYLAIVANIGKQELSVEAVTAVLQRQVAAIMDDKSLMSGKIMLAAQASTLDQLYNLLAQRAISAAVSSKTDQAGVFLKLGLRAQSQCRATWETLHILGSPPVARQTNIALNQQVNNGQVAPASAGRDQNSQGKVLEQTAHEPDAWLERSASGAAASSNSTVEAVATFNRTEIR
jgi:hypothetical protein